MWLRHLMANASAHMYWEKTLYKKRFDKEGSLNRVSLQIGSFAFFPREHVKRNEAVKNWHSLRMDRMKVPQSKTRPLWSELAPTYELSSGDSLFTSPVFNTRTPSLDNYSAVYHCQHGPLPSPQDPNHLAWNHSTSPHRSMLSQRSSFMA